MPRSTAARGWYWSPSNPPEVTDQYLPGKWMLFPPCGAAVSAWQAVVTAAARGSIWQAKIAPHAANEGHLICVYTPDFRDQPGAERIAVLLDDLGLVQRTLYYKPDVFTYARIYSSGSGGASIYNYRPADRRLRTTPALERALAMLAARPAP